MQLLGALSQFIWHNQRVGWCSRYYRWGRYILYKREKSQDRSESWTKVKHFMLVAPVTRWPGDPVNETARWPSFANILQRRTRRYPAALASEATAGSALASMRVSYVIRVSVSCAAASASSAELQTMNQSNRPDASFTWRTPSSEDRRSTFTTRVHVHTRLQKEKQDHKRVKRSGPKIICSFPK